MSRILIVDDEIENIAAIQRLLRREGYDFSAATSGRQALKRVTEFLPDLIIMDVLMPGLSGYNLCREIKSKTESAGILIMMLSDNMVQPKRLMGYEAGADDILIKPYAPEELQTRVKILLRLKQAQKTLQDEIAGRKLIEEEFKKNEEKFRAVIESSSDPIVVYDQEGRANYVNKAFKRVFGWSPEELIGKRIDFVPEEEIQKTHEIIRQVMGGEACCFETCRFTKMGHKIDVSISADLYRNSKGESLGIVSNLHDITEYKRNEIILKQAKEEADSASRAKSEFLANMSHELRTPMNGVIGMASLLMETNLNPEQQEYAEIVISSANALLTVINDILDYTTIEAGKLDLNIIDFDLRTTMEEVGDLLGFRAYEKGLEFNTRIHYEVPTLLRGDPGRLRQILLNLAGNAIKFTKKGEVMIDVTREKETADQVEILFNVRDTGIGISAESVNRLFKSFSQLDATITRRYGGSGLGLTISKKLVEMMGGRINVRSEPDKGSDFFFSVVLDKQSEDSCTAIDNLKNIKGQRVLVVNDHTTGRQVLMEMLKLWGCDVDEASTVKETLEKLKNANTGGRPFQIAVIDHNKPQLDGEYLGTYIKADPLLKDTFLVMITAMGRRGDAAKSQEIGFSAYLTKPVKQSQLYDCLTMVANLHIESCVQGTRKIITRYSLEDDRRRRIRILIVDDNSTNQKVMIDTLKKCGYHAYAVSNGNEALAAVRSFPYDIVLMDVQMPEMDGIEAIRAIRRLESESATGGHITIIAVTAHAMAADQANCMEAGMDDYLPKPFNQQELLEKINNWVSRPT